MHDDAATRLIDREQRIWRPSLPTGKNDRF
jgi:hypothetical protein